MKHSFLKSAAILVLLAASYGVKAQSSVAIGTSTVDPNAVLLLVGNGSQGLILPSTANAAGMPKTAGMVVYETSTSKVWYCDGTTWVPVGSGGGASTISISGNTVTVGSSSIKLANADPTGVAGQILMWDGSKWIASSTTAPINGNVLQWNGTQWTPVALPGGGDMLKATYDPSSKSADAFILTNHTGTVNSAQILDNSVTSNDIFDGTISTADLSNSLAISTSGSITTIGAGGNLTIGGTTNFNGRTYSWPAAAAGVGTFLRNDGLGNLTWAVSAAALDLTGQTGVLIGNGLTTSGLPASGPLQYLRRNAGNAAYEFAALVAADIPVLNVSKLTSGILGVNRGGTGLGSTPSNGQLLIGNGAGFTSATITAGAGISVTNGAGSITVANTGMSNPLTTTGDIIYGVGITPTRLAGAAGFLKSTGAAAPAWSAINLASTDITGILPFANGGTGVTTFAGNMIPRSTGTVFGASNIFSDGTNVSIGSPAATERLDVTGNVRFSGALMPNNLPGTSGQVLTSAGLGLPPTWNAVVTSISPANTVIRGNAAGTLQVPSSFFDDGAYTAINRTFPIGAARFDIGTNAISGNYGGMYIDTQTGGKPFYGFSQNGGGGAWIEWDGADANKMKFVNGAPRMTLQTDGKVGIGTTSPLNQLDVAGGMVIGSGFAGVNTATANGLGIQGFLGVGTASPTFDIHVNKSSSVATMKIESNSSAAYMYIDKSSALDNSFLGFMTAGSDRWVVGPYATAGTDAFRLIDWQNGGSVNSAFYMERSGTNSLGLGTSTPVNKLDVEGAVAIGTSYSGTSAAPPDGLLVEGEVNFGDTSPQGRFNVGGDGGIQGVIVINRTLTDGVMVRFRRNGGTVGDISTAGGITSYNAFTGSHYATIEGSVEKGMLVTLTGANKYLENNESSELMYGVSKSHLANDPKIMGSYLGLQTLTAPHDSSNPHLIMAVGNGEIWVIDQGQDLEPGDYLISSSVEGHAMKDTGEFEVANVVARVAEPVTWSAVSQNINGIKHKRVSVFFESFARNHKADKLEKDVLEMKEQINIITRELERLRNYITVEAKNK